MNLFLELLKIIIPAGLVFAAAFFTIKRFLDHEKEKRQWQSQSDRKSTRLNSSHIPLSRMPSSA